MRRDGPPTLAELLARDAPANDVADAIARECCLVPHELMLAAVHALASQVAGTPSQVSPAELLPRLLACVPEDVLPGAARFAA